MGMFESFNKSGSGAILPESVDLTALEFHKLAEFVGQELTLKGFFFSNGTYGKQVVIYTTTPTYPMGVKINMPKRYVALFEEVLKTPNAKEQILSNHCLISNIQTKKTKTGKDTVVFNFKDC